MAALAIVCLAGAPLAAAAGGEPPSRRQLVDPLVTAVSPEQVTAVTADIVVRHSRVDATGRARGRQPVEVAYRLERTRTARGWTSVMKLTRRPKAMVRGSDGDLAIDRVPAVTRIEDPGDGTPVRVFNARGVEVRLPSRSDVRALAKGAPGALRGLGLPGAAADGTEQSEPPAAAADDPVRALLAVAGDKRRADVARRLGPPSGRVRGLDRHTVSEGDEITETLVDPASGLPVETSVVKDGRRVEHITQVYARAAGGAMLRRSLRTERLLPDGAGDRLITDVEFAGVRFEVGGVR